MDGSAGWVWLVLRGWGWGLLRDKKDCWGGRMGGDGVLDGIDCVGVLGRWVWDLL